MTCTAFGKSNASVGKAGHDINIDHEFFRYQPQRPLANTDAKPAEVEQRIMGMLREVIG